MKIAFSSKLSSSTFLGFDVTYGRTGRPQNLAPLHVPETGGCPITLVPSFEIDKILHNLRATVSSLWIAFIFRTDTTFQNAQNRSSSSTVHWSQISVLAILPTPTKCLIPQSSFHFFYVAQYESRGFSLTCLGIIGRKCDLPIRRKPDATRLSDRHIFYLLTSSANVRRRCRWCPYRSTNQPQV